MSRFARGLLAAALAAGAVGATAGAAGAATVSRPLPASDYSVRPLCGEPGPGEASCFALKLVPQTATARERATPIGMTLHRRVEPQSAASGSFGLRPQDLHSGYGLPAESPAPQTVAIVDAYDDPTAEADLAAYDAEFGLPECTEANGCFRKVNQSGSPSPLPAYNSEWAGEIALDVETVHAVCQNCKILLVEAENSASSSLEAAENTAVAMGATEVSNSFGSAEPASEGSGYDHPGVVITASTGDDGYLNWSSSSSFFRGHPNYPASSPDVVAVGGTRLSLNGGTRVGETAWNDGSALGDGYGAGGGGCSEGPSAPAWQSAVEDWAAVGCGTKRAAADVGAVGDPFSGLAVYGNGHWSTVGGTSLASPVIAATFALAGGSGGVGFPAQTVYGHLGSAGLFDVTEGSNGECANAFDYEGETAGCTTAEEEADCEGDLICKAGPGYDGPTGVGTPSGVTAFAPPAPSVSEVSPSSGDLGTVVTIGGEHLKGVGSVKFGGAEATGIEEISATQLEVTAPGHEPGAVDVTVTTGGGTSATGAADRFTYLAEPAVSKVEPAKGPSEGGASVTIRGEMLGGTTAVSFGGVPATDVVAVSEDEVTATTPAHAEGAVDVTVTTPDGTSAATALDRYTYVARPSVSAVEPGAGTIAGGTAVTIRGTNLTEASAVDFGATAATGVVEASPTELTVTSPAHAEGSVDVTVTTPGGTSAVSGADEFQYLSLPVVTGVAPAAGPLAGGTQVTITGHDLGAAGAVRFGAATATGLTPVSATELTVTSPAHVAGAVDVTVTTPTGASNPEPADRFTYVAAPTLVSAPAISGYPMEGRTLSASPGSWSNEPTAYAYRWLSCDSGGASCAAIDGATGGSYRLEAADVGQTIRVEVTASNAGGQASEVSPATAAVLTRSSRSFAWAGATPVTAGAGADAWTASGNWEGGTAPSEAGDIGTLTLPSLAGNPGCVGTPVDACYQSRNDIAGIGVEKVVANDRYPYIVYGEPFTLGAGGIEAVSNSSEANEHVPSFRMPIALGADQRWSVEGPGDALGFGGLELEGSIGGESHSLHIELSDLGVVSLVGSPDDEVGPVTIEGADPGKTGSESESNGILGLGLEPPEDAPRLNADDGNSVHLKDVAMIGAGTVGPLTVEGGLVDVAEPFPEPGDPFGTLAVNGPATFDSASSLFFFLGGGATPGEDFSQLKATGDVDLGGAELVTLGEPFSPCPDLAAGSELPLVSTTGRLEGTFAGVPDGSLVLEGCWGPASVLRIEYTAHSVTATSLGEIPFSISAPSVSGTAIDEQTLHGHAGAWANEPSSYTYQWKRCDASGNGCSAISGATSSDYTLTPDDAGDTVRLEATAHNAAGEASSTSAPTGPVVLPLPYNIAAPAISGNLVEGQTLSTTNGSWWYSVTGYTYQWERCPVGGGGCTDIPGATDQTYTLTSADVGNTIDVVVTAHNATGQTAMSPYFRTSIVEPRPPANTGPPTISGSPVEGQILSAASGAWERPSYYTYQWLRCDSGGSNCGAIGGAGGPSYLLGAGDVGSTIEVQVTAHNGGGEASAISAHTEVVLPPAPTYFGFEPSISGAPVEGNVLSEGAGIGSWSHNPTITYQWLDCDPVGNGCVPIAGAFDQTYTVAAADVGHSIRVEEIGTNGGGHASVTSFPTGVATPAPPAAIDAPAITGNAVEGQQLSASQGSWTHNPYSFSYLWLRCDSSGSGCSAIPGATEQSYVLGAADVGHEIEVEVVATNAGGSGYSTSSPTAVVSAEPGEGGGGGEGEGGGGEGGGGSGGGSSGGSGAPSGGGGSGPVAAGIAVAGAKAPVKGAKAAIAMSCTGSGPCGGTLTLQIASGGKAHRKRHPMRGRVHRKGAQTIGRASFSIPAGDHETVSAHLTGKGQALVRKAGKKGLVAQLAGTGIASRQLKLQEK